MDKKQKKEKTYTYTLTTDAYLSVTYEEGECYISVGDNYSPYISSVIPIRDSESLKNLISTLNDIVKAMESKKAS